MAARVKEHRTSLKRKRDNYARKLRRKKIIKYLRSELRSCTTHGLPYIVVANMGIHWSERLFWAFSFVFSLGVIVFLLSMQYSRYKNTPTVTSVEMDYFNWNVSYPAITLCPLNKIEEDELYNFVNETLEFNGEDIESHLRALCSLSMDSLDVIDYNELKLSSSVYPKDHAALASMLFKKFDNNSLTTSTNWPISVEIAMTEMGMCHVINSNVAVFHNPMKWDTTQYVKSNIDLSVYDRDFFVQLANYAHIYKVFIHSPDEIVLSTTPSYTSKRKSFIHFGVQVWSTRISSVLKATPISIRKCRFIDEPISQRHPIYTYNHCILECKIQMILSVCDCLPHFYKPLENERICNMTELHCFREHKNAFIKLSASESLANFSSKDLPRSPRDCGCLTTCESHVFRKDHENFLPEPVDNRIRISISSYPKVRVVRDFIFNTYDFILRGAGVINLCVGASIISIMELILLSFKVLLQTVWSYIKYLCARMTIHSAFVNWIKRIIKKQH